MKVNAIIQARCGSTRLPGKIFMAINGKPLLWHVVNRLKYAELIDDIIVATTTDSKDDATEEWCNENEIKCYRGSEDDVLNRFYNAAVAFPCDVIVRVTADDPFKEPTIVDKIIKKLIDENLDLSCNVFPPSFPEGLDCEVFTFNVLETMEKTTNNPYDREHVTPYIYNHPEKFKIGNLTSSRQLSNYRWTIDNKEDYEMVNAIYEKRRNEQEEILLMEEILEILEENPEIASINSDVKRSAMYQK
ncbi:MAG: glycosyltransferase family protein [Methanobrevibacter sp.]|uniref:glycosyltransferase family protein n=1 Tax=Methanobrevibacter sp. TaxID=66852 RepID=UPI0025E97F6C|nr:glycosyltransferase family protein [Methanobrevibacter sp.]MBQ6098511.1 glycosyltransferase family protein [Methanobrevibacter sp.]